MIICRSTHLRCLPQFFINNRLVWYSYANKIKVLWPVFEAQRICSGDQAFRE